MNEAQFISATSSPECNPLTLLTTSDIIQICSVIVALFVGVVSIIISIRTLRQNAPSKRTDYKRSK